MRRIRILADKMLSVERFLPQLPELSFDVSEFDGRSIPRALVRTADALLVRSVTPVDNRLLEGSGIQFVGSATIGKDHVDTDWLVNNTIRFSYAPGCNANAVVDYVMACLIDFFTTKTLPFKKIGIVGYGNVGRRLAACLRRFNIDICVYDPLVSVPDAFAADSLNQVLSCDAVSLHVPLTKTGAHATYHMIDSQALERCKDGALLINTSRGSVINNSALYACLATRPELCVTLDVWENEPAINLELVPYLIHATGHIAGYSEAGKARGSCYVLRAMLKHFGCSHSQVDKWFKQQVDALTSLDITQFGTLDAYGDALSSVCRINHETECFKAQLAQLGATPADNFDHYRKAYRLRDEINYDALLQSLPGNQT